MKATITIEIEGNDAQDIAQISERLEYLVMQASRDELGHAVKDIELKVEVE